MGFIVAIDRNNKEVLEVRKQDSCLITTIATSMRFYFYNYDSFYALEEEKQQQLFNLLTQYASTPIEDREEEKKYRYYLKDTTGLNLKHGNLLYKQKDFNNFMFDIDMFNENEIKCEFTHKELRACGIDITLLQENYKEVEIKEQ